MQLLLSSVLESLLWCGNLIDQCSRQLALSSVGKEQTVPGKLSDRMLSSGVCAFDVIGSMQFIYASCADCKPCMRAA